MVAEHHHSTEPAATQVASRMCRALWPKFGGHCPNRVALRAETAGTKSKAGKRGIGLPNELALMLRHHKLEQDTERTTAAQLWRETGYVFTTPTGEPLNPRNDYTEWKRLLVRAEVPERRLHDARHRAVALADPGSHRHGRDGLVQHGHGR
jgi:integrase